MHLFAIKNNLVRRAVLVASLPTLAVLLTGAVVLQAIDEVKDEVAKELPGVGHDLVGIWNQPISMENRV